MFLGRRTLIGIDCKLLKPLVLLLQVMPPPQKSTSPKEGVGWIVRRYGRVTATVLCTFAVSISSQACAGSLSEILAEEGGDGDGGSSEEEVYEEDPDHVVEESEAKGGRTGPAIRGREWGGDGGVVSERRGEKARGGAKEEEVGEGRAASRGRGRRLRRSREAQHSQSARHLSVDEATLSSQRREDKEAEAPSGRHSSGLSRRAESRTKRRSKSSAATVAPTDDVCPLP